MMKFLTLFFFSLLLFPASLIAQDTVFVKAFRFDDYKTNGYKGMIKFPPKSERMEKVLMRYKLRCPYERNCGEWDYLAYVFLLDTTNKIDTIKRTTPSFRVNGQERDSLVFITETAYQYTFNKQTGKVDSTALPSQTLVLYEDSQKPTQPTDTLDVWSPYYRYTFDDNGNKTDSVLVGNAILIRKIMYEYFEYPRHVERYELARYITPYGNWLTPDWKGFEWVYDVSDYRPLLTDSAYIDASSLFYPWTVGWYELLDLTFVFIKGTPPRDPLSVTKVWNGGPAYGIADNPISKFLVDKRFTLEEEAKNCRLKLNVTGHGFGGTDNCAEFCPRTHTIIANNTNAFQDEVFRNDCGLNPLYPQAGTWIYDRGNWCPGAEVTPIDIELSHLIQDTRNLNLGYKIEDYRWNGQGSVPTYVIESQLITYGNPNFQTDAAVTEIITPNRHEYYSRMNPICNNPVIVIQNTGTELLKSATIEYGVKGQRKAIYSWNGELRFLEKETLTLPPFTWGNWDGDINIFEAIISNPNGKSDQYAPNSRMESVFEVPDVRDSTIVVRVVTNRRSSQNAWRITDANNKIVAQRRSNQMRPESLTRDTLTLPKGCYRFIFTDQAKDGLEFFVNNDRNGIGRVSLGNVDQPTNEYKAFQPNFGTNIVYNFTVGFSLNNDTVPYYTSRVKQHELDYGHFFVYPNPNDGQFEVTFDLPQPQSVHLRLRNTLGQEIKAFDYKAVSFETMSIDLRSYPKGVYFLQMETNQGMVTRKVVLQ